MTHAGIPPHWTREDLEKCWFAVEGTTKITSIRNKQVIITL